MFHVSPLSHGGREEGETREELCAFLCPLHRLATRFAQGFAHFVLPPIRFCRRFRGRCRSREFLLTSPALGVNISPLCLRLCAALPEGTWRLLRVAMTCREDL